MDNAGVSTADESQDDYEFAKSTERWAPIGAADTESELKSLEIQPDRLKSLEHDQEELNRSLLSLTSHFAQVQFRLKQIVNAPQSEKENLLRELENFASRGCPDIGSIKMAQDDHNDLSGEEKQKRLAEKRMKQVELISQLKDQLKELELFAYESGGGGLPQSLIVEKQKAIIDQLRNRLNINLDDFDQMSNDDLKRIVDVSIQQFVNPVKARENLLYQLQSQINDLERFIEFLMKEGSVQPVGNLAHCSCANRCPVHSGKNSNCCSNDAEKTKKTDCKINASGNERVKNLHLIKKALLVMQVYIFANFGCGQFVNNRLNSKFAPYDSSYEERLKELSDVVKRIIDINRRQEASQSDYLSDSSDTPPVLVNSELLRAVRKQLFESLKAIVEFGMIAPSAANSLMSFSCLSIKSASMRSRSSGHIWLLFLKYYEIKHGDEYNEMPAKKLSDAFNLEVVGGKAVTIKQTLLNTIYQIVNTHEPLKRSHDTQFKSFICKGLNEKKLSLWFRLVLRTPEIVDVFYTSWSYMLKSGFEEFTKTLEKLNGEEFNLPSDIAIKPFKNIKDAF